MGSSSGVRSRGTFALLLREKGHGTWRIPIADGPFYRSGRPRLRSRHLQSPGSSVSVFGREELGSRRHPVKRFLLTSVLMLGLSGSLLAQFVGDVLGSHNLSPSGTSPVKGGSSAGCLYLYA